MRIAWCSATALPGAIETFDPLAVVSIRSPGMFFGNVGDRPHVRLQLHDVESRSIDAVAPNHRHVQAVVDLVEHRWIERLLITCTAGLSRSPALAIVATVKAHHDPAEACARIRQLVPHAQPNRLILSIASEILRRDVLTPALNAFAYTRGRGHPTGARVGLIELGLNVSETVR